ncbi:oligopeptidase PepB [Clostridiales bacterium S5-A14a]|nr:oligopeptidase PepB [Clostridiales bacterium S5-A14a]
MGNKFYENRNDIDIKYRWNLEEMYSNDKLWENDIDTAEKLTQEFLKRKGSVMKSSSSLLASLRAMEEIDILLEKAFVYARMRMDEDNRDSKRQKNLDMITSTLAKLGSDLSFFIPEILEASEAKIREFMSEEQGLDQYSHMLETLLRNQSHVLSEEEENILASLSQVNSAPHAIFNMLNNADMKFGEIVDEKGNSVELTHGNYITMMQSHNRDVRKNAFEKIYQTYEKLINTISSTYAYSVKNDVVRSQIRKYPSARNASLYPDNIPESVYDNLVKVVSDNLTNLHRYMSLRKKVLGIENQHMWDVYVPLVELPENEYPFEDGVDIVLKALSPLGNDYCNALKNGIDSRWIDVYETPGKTSGAYSFGSYNSMPYSLMNYTDTLNDVFTLIHEMGHSMHSYYTRKTQPYTYGDHSIFTAEVASTVNESLLIKYLLENEKDIEVRKYLINFYLEQFRATLFRQTMFAEFEHMCHDYVENNGSLTPSWLNEEYEKLNQKYYGNSIEKDDYIKYEWARIPHFYRAYYVYQYATGFSAATSLSKRILEGGEKERDDYLKFLSLGSSKYPVDLLKIAGVDMTSTKPVSEAMQTFNTLLDELERLYK